ncbi:MAG: hypothetical protein JWM16_3748, partial [Verrucomicrobiales bacterium]|nr:hypothetical protein [Verrucomicrobiales bacterium]
VFLVVGVGGLCWRFVPRKSFEQLGRLRDSISTQIPNTLSRAESAGGFRLLFNGKDLTGWKAAGENWTVEDGAIKRTGSGGNLQYDAETMPDNFELRFQWKIAASAHSAVIYRPGGYQYHIVDNREPVPREARKMAAGIYDFIGPSVDKTKPVGEWNEARILCVGTKVEHWLNGEKVVAFDYAAPEWEPLVRSFKQKNRIRFSNRGGNLILHDRRGTVWFRDLKLKTILE